nr:reverse transcriptase domain-containing protein [Tanacetum cinerariifolium]
MPLHFHKKFRWGTVFATEGRSFIEPGIGHRMKRKNRRTRVPIDLYPCHIEEKMTIKELAMKEEVEENEGLKEFWEQMENMVRTTRQNPTPEPNPDIAAIIVQQLQNILPQIVTQVTTNVNNANGGEGNDRNNGCSYKTFTACNPNEFDEKGGAVALTHRCLIIKSAILTAGILTDEAVRCGTLTKGNDNRKKIEESSKQGSTWKDNKKDKIGSGFVATVPPKNDNKQATGQARNPLALEKNKNTQNNGSQARGKGFNGNAVEAL